MKTDIAKEAVGKWPFVLQHFGVDEAFLRNRHGPCPMCGGEDRWRWDNKEGKGTFFCNQCGSGDGFTLLMNLKGWSFKEAADKVREILPGVVALPEKKDTGKMARLSKAADLWREAKPVVKGDEVWKYLNNRGLEASSDVLRCAKNVPYYDNRKKTGQYAAMLAPITDSSGNFKSLHVTYLDNGGKADVPSPKKILVGGIQGCAVQLFPAKNGRIALAEGIETALAVHRLTSVTRPVWAAISASGMEHISLPNTVKHVAIYADNDNNFVGQLAAYKLAARLHKAGICATVHIPSCRGYDWADFLEETHAK